MSELDPTAPDPLDGAFNSDWLMGETFPPLEYVVPGMIPEGLTVLSAAPKIGKSWMVLGLGYAAATGGMAFGRIPVQKRPVLYLALEDGPRRLQDRLRTIGVQDGHRDLTMMTSVPPGLHVADTIRAFLERNDGRRPLVILDTLGKVRGIYNGSDAYQKDYAQMSTLKDLVDAWPGTSLIVVHHTKKAETVDALDSVSGTQGLAGGVDSVLVLRRERQSQAAVLHVIARDAAEGEYAVSLVDGVWSLDGATLHAAADAARTQKAVAGLGDQMTELVNIIARYPEGIRRKDLEELMHVDGGTLGKNLTRAVEADRIRKIGRGLYGPATSATSAITPSQRAHELWHSQDSSATNPEGDSSNVAHVALVTPLHREGGNE